MKTSTAIIAALCITVAAPAFGEAFEWGVIYDLEVRIKRLEARIEQVANDCNLQLETHKVWDHQ